MQSLKKWGTDRVSAREVAREIVSTSAPTAEGLKSRFIVAKLKILTSTVEGLDQVWYSRANLYPHGIDAISQGKGIHRVDLIPTFSPLS